MDSYTMQTLSASSVPLTESMTTASSVFASEIGDTFRERKAKRQFPLKRLIFGVLIGLLIAALALGIAKLVSSRRARMPAMETPVLPPPVPVAPGIKIWTTPNPLVKYPMPYEVRLRDTEINHRDSHPYFVKTSPEDYRHHLVITGTATTNTLSYLTDKWQGKITQRIANCISLHETNSEPVHRLALLFTDFQLHINTLEALRSGRITDPALAKVELEELLLLVEKTLPETARESLSKMNKKAKAKEDKLNYNRVKNTIRVTKNYKPQMVHAIVNRYKGFLTPDMQAKYATPLKKKKQRLTTLRKENSIRTEMYLISAYVEMLAQMRKEKY